MSCSLIATRNALYGRLSYLFEHIEEIYPDMERLKKPKVYPHTPTDEPPFYVALDEVATPVTTAGRTSNAHDHLVYTHRVLCFAKHSDPILAADMLATYEELVIAAVMADPQIDRTCDNAFAAVEDAGTGVDASKYFIAASSIAIECTHFAECSCKVRELIKQQKEA